MTVRYFLAPLVLCTSLALIGDAEAAATKKKTKKETTETTTETTTPAPAPAPEPAPAPAPPPPEPTQTTTTHTETTTINAAPAETTTKTETTTTTTTSAGPGSWDVLGGGIVQGGHMATVGLQLPALAVHASYLYGIAGNIAIGATVGSSSFYSVSPSPFTFHPTGVLALSVRIGFLNDEHQSLGLRLDPYIALSSQNPAGFVLGAGLHAQVGYLKWFAAKRLGVGAALDANFDFSIMPMFTFQAPILAGLIIEYHFTDNFGLYASALGGATFDRRTIWFAFNSTIGVSAHF